MRAEWIAFEPDRDSRVLTFKKRIYLKGEVKEASLRITAFGIYNAYLNGERLGRQVLTPGWTDYRSRIQYQTIDIGGKLRRENELSVGVGVGWAVGIIGGGPTLKHNWGDTPALLLELEIIYEDGERELISSDESFEVFDSEVRFAEIYHGETVDLGYTPKKLGMAKRIEPPSAAVPQIGEDITEQDVLMPVGLIVTPKGERVIDFGQNMTGYVTLDIRAPRGSRTVLHHAEVLDGDGNFYTGNYRSAKNELIFIASGGDDHFKPRYSFQGFRYVKVSEYPFEEIDPDSFRAIVVSSEIRRTGRYISGNPLINQLYSNIIWGQRSNYLDLPTDCPQRDERLGWLGDAEVFCRTAAINYDIDKFFDKWLLDVESEQERRGGAIEGVVPTPRMGFTLVSAAWGDAATVIPWELYLAYGDRERLRKRFKIMKAWVDYQRAAGPCEELWLGGIHFGDWLAMDSGGETTKGATSTDLIASAYYLHSTELLCLAGEAIGEEVSEYRELYGRIRRAFREYFMEDGLPKKKLPHTEIGRSVDKPEMDIERRGDTQTAIVLILHFGIAEESERPMLTAELLRLIREAGGVMTTGFVGTPYILHALSENGQTDLAYELLFNERSPSWLYSVMRGATTMWEHWNSIREDGSFWSTSMNSFNHYAYGAVFDWIFGVSSGIKPIEPGYRKIAFAPHPDKRLGFADASIETALGRVALSWKYVGEAVRYAIEVPSGASAVFTLPSGRSFELGEGKYHFTEEK